MQWAAVWSHYDSTLKVSSIFSRQSFHWIVLLLHHSAIHSCNSLKWCTLLMCSSLYTWCLVCFKLQRTCIMEHSFKKRLTTLKEKWRLMNLYFMVAMAQLTYKTSCASHSFLWSCSVVHSPVQKPVVLHHYVTICILLTYQNGATLQRRAASQRKFKVIVHCFSLGTRSRDE